MKKTIRYFFILLLMGAIVGGGYYAYKSFVFTYSARALNIIPNDAAFIIETKEPIANWKKLQQSTFWQHLRTHPYFGEINGNIQFLDSLIAQNQTLFDLFGSRYLTLSAHKTEAKNFDFLYVIDLEEQTAVKSFQGLVRPLLKSINQNISLQTYKDYEIIKIVNPQVRGEAIYLTTCDNLLLCSYTVKLLYKAIDQKNEPYFETQPSMTAVRRLINEDAMLNIYVQFGTLDDFLKIYSTSNELLNTLSKTTDLAGIELNLADDKFEMDGYIFLRDSVSSMLHALLDVPQGNAQAAKVLPARTAIYTALLFDDYTKVLQSYEQSLQTDDPKAYKEYKDNIQTVEKFLKINIQQDFISWIRGELAIVMLPPRLGIGKPDQLVVLHTHDSTAAAKGLTHISEQIRKRTPMKFKQIDYKDYKINRLQVKGLFKALMGKFFKKFDDYMPYYTMIGEYVIFSNSQNSLESLIDDYQNQSTLAQQKHFSEFAANFSKEGSVLSYIDMEQMLPLMPEYLDRESWARMQQNQDYFKSFRFIGVQLSAQGTHYQSRIQVQYIPQTDEDNEESQDSTANHDIVANSEHPDGVFLDTYPNGTPRTQGFYKDGLAHGEFKFYHKNGQLSHQGNFQQGKKTGKWYYYNKKGRLLRKEEYDSDGNQLEHTSNK